MACAKYYLIAESVFILVGGIVKGTNEGRVEVCEFEDANLLFPNIPASSAGDIRAKTWNKENGVLLASWMASTNFVTSPLYEDRVMAIGENSIKIRNATRSDAGTYTLVLTTGSTQDFIEFLVRLEVLVSPLAQCTPSITREGDSLIAKLPPDACGTPNMKPIWINRTQKLIYGNINVIDLDPELRGEIYVVCALGESRRCFQGDVNYLCANYTISEPDIKNESGSMLVTTIIVPLLIIFILITVGVILACYFRWKSRRKKQPASTALDTTEMTDVACEKQALIKYEISAKDLADTKLHLINQYTTMKSADLSYSRELNLGDISEVYFDLDIMSLRIENVGGRGNVSIASLEDIVCIDKRNENTAKTVQPIPAVILGQCGIGKTTWCEHLVHEWCSYHNNMETNLKVGHANIPEVTKFEILLFMPLKYKLEGSSFAECLRKQLFCNAPLNFVHTMNYISKHSESVLVIIDGLDAVTDNLEPIADLLKSKETFPCTIVFTSRPDGLQCLQTKEKRALRLFQIHGLKLESAKEYVEKVVGIHCRIHGDELSAEQFWECLRHFQVQSLCRVPLLCSSLVLSWIQSKAFSDNLTDFLFTVVECYVRRAMTRRWFSDNIEKVLESNDLEIKIKDKKYSREHGYILKVISNVANKIWSLPKQNNQAEKTIEIGNLTKDIGEDCVQLCVETGILSKTFVSSKTKKRTHISFSHVLLFDFFVALSLAIGKQDSSGKNVKIQKVATKHAYIMDMLQEIDPEYWIRNK